MQQMPHPMIAGWEFIVQALTDFGRTLPPSARAAFEQKAQHHINQLTPAIAQATVPAPEKRPRKAKDAPKGGETTGNPAQTPPAA